MTAHKPRPRRSFIFTPGLRPDMFPKALASGSDIVCVELEDGIAPKDKAEERQRALALFETSQVDDGVERIVRINSIRERFGIEDVNAILATDTPPFGYALFALKAASPSLPMGKTYRAAWAVVAIFTLAITILYLVPGIVTLVPSLL